MGEKKRYTLKEYDKYQYIAFDEDKPMIALNLKAFGTYACFHQIIDKLNGQDERIKELKLSNKLLRANRKSCERGRIRERKNWENMDKMRIKHIQFLQKRLKKNGLSIYINDGDDMSKNKRYDVTNEDYEVSIKDNITENILFSLTCENPDDIPTVIQECLNCTNIMNNLWEQTMRFEAYTFEKQNILGMIDKIVTKTDLDSREACKSALKRIDELTNGYGY